LIGARAGQGIVPPSSGGCLKIELILSNQVLCYLALRTMLGRENYCITHQAMQIHKGRVHEVTIDYYFTVSLCAAISFTLFRTRGN